MRKWCSVFSLMAMATVSSTSMADIDVTEGRINDIILTSDFQAKTIIDYDDYEYRQIITVDPMACVQFSRGLQPSLHYTINNEPKVLTADDSTWQTRPVTVGCLTPLVLGSEMARTPHLANNKHKRGTVFLKEPGSNLSVSPFAKNVNPPPGLHVSFKKRIAIKEGKAQKQMTFDVVACLNPNYKGSMTIEYTGQQETFELPAARQDVRLGRIIGAACLTLARPYEVLAHADPDTRTNAKLIWNWSVDTIKALNY